MAFCTRRAAAIASFALATCSLAAAAEPVEAVYSLVRKEKPAVVETLRQLVGIESGSRDREGLDRIAEVLKDRLAALGGQVELMEAGADAVKLFDTPPRTGRTVVARFEGTGTRKIMLLAHMDTVYPRGTLAKRPFRIEGSRAYGPGVADEKGGVAVVVHALAVLKSLGFREYGMLTVLINGDEELSTPGARNLITRLAAQHDVVFSCEPSPAPKDELALATSGIAAATLTVRGRPAHAGVNPEDGRNALLELAHQLLQTRDQVQLDDRQRGHDSQRHPRHGDRQRGRSRPPDRRLRRRRAGIPRSDREGPPGSRHPGRGGIRAPPPAPRGDRAIASAREARAGDLRRVGQAARPGRIQQRRRNRRRLRRALGQAGRP